MNLNPTKSTLFTTLCIVDTRESIGGVNDVEDLLFFYPVDGIFYLWSLGNSRYILGISPFSDPSSRIDPNIILDALPN